MKIIVLFKIRLYKIKIIKMKYIKWFNFYCAMKNKKKNLLSFLIIFKKIN